MCCNVLKCRENKEVILKASDKSSDVKSPRQKLSLRRVKAPLPAPRVSDETRLRLYEEAYAPPAFEGMNHEAVRECIDWKLTEFLAKQPFWYGHTDGRGGADVRHRASARQYEARRTSRLVA
ncbi:MAG: hypothetical protein LZF60_340165 [Nitrospira sp.]|nr:MAG: hypothetical protein LZF60_340165 [Nitrospira sp.]